MWILSETEAAQTVWNTTTMKNMKGASAHLHKQVLKYCFFLESSVGWLGMFYRPLACWAEVPLPWTSHGSPGAGCCSLVVAEDRDTKINVPCGLSTARTENFQVATMLFRHVSEWFPVMGEKFKASECHLQWLCKSEDGLIALKNKNIAWTW